MVAEMIKNYMPHESEMKYSRETGRKERDDGGDLIHVTIYVSDLTLGYGVFRLGVDLHLLYWDQEMSACIEWAVDRARKESEAHKLIVDDSNNVMSSTGSSFVEGGII